MRSTTPKVLHTLGGRSMLGHVLAAVAPLEPDHTLVVVGHGREHVAASLSDTPATPVVQDVQLGTGHAVRTALLSVPNLITGSDRRGTVVVVPGDTPLLTAETLRRVVEEHESSGADVTLLTAVVDDPTGYGRVIRAGGQEAVDDSGAPVVDAGQVTRIVEHKDATDAQRQVREISTSVYAFAAGPLNEALDRLSTNNAQGEEYLTDAVELLVSKGGRVATVAADPREIVGVNDRVQLAAARRALNERLLDAWMRAGVTVVDPASTWVDVDVELGTDVTLHPHTQLHGATRIETGAEIGPEVTLVDTFVGTDARIVRAQCDSAEVGPGVSVGPFTYLRPGTRLARGAKAGTFVEIKASEIGEGTKVPHLSYVGDATIGDHTNIGAATVFVNYDGVSKHRSVIGSYARTGADNMFVAPVTVGDGAYTGAGSVIRRDVPPGALGVSGGPQRNIAGWTERRRAGTPAAEAAAGARAEQDDPDTGQ